MDEFAGSNPEGNVSKELKNGLIYRGWIMLDPCWEHQLLFSIPHQWLCDKQVLVSLSFVALP